MSDKSEPESENPQKHVKGDVKEFAKGNAQWFDRQLQATWPNAACELYWKDHWQLLVAVVCSARATDERVNQVVAHLHEHLASIEAWAESDPREVAELLKRLPLYQQKARALVEAARYIIEHYDGVVPSDPEQLTALPGVGRKTAAVIAGNGFGVPAIAADVHVQRIVHRWAWTNRPDPVRAEEAISHALSPERWVRACHQLIRLGREHCRPKRPWCSRCPCRELCPQNGVTDAR